MTTLDTMNSKSNLDCIADELFTDLAPEITEIIQGGKKYAIELYDTRDYKRRIGAANNHLSGPNMFRIDSFIVNSGIWVFKNKDGKTIGRISGYGTDGASRKKWRIPAGSSLDNTIYSVTNIG